ncbi:amidohydrolase, partial [Streptomyces sp. 6N223]
MSAGFPPLPPLVDHHCHGVVREGPGGAEAFEAFLTEADVPAAPGTSYFDTQLGFAVRRWCGPVLGLEPHCPAEQYLARRGDLGAGEVTRRMLRASGIGEFLVDTGVGGAWDFPGVVREVVRLEWLAERVADQVGDDSEAFVARLDAEIAEAAESAVAFKSVAAYRYGLDLDPRPPSEAEVRGAAWRWLRRRSSQDGGSAPVPPAAHT